MDNSNLESGNFSRDEKIYVAGHRGLVGSAIVRCLKDQGYDNLLLRTHDELELTDQKAVKEFFEIEKPDYVILAAAKVGGIHANNTYPADFIYQNMMIESNVIHFSYKSRVKRLLFLGSTCIYPREVTQPMQEEALLTGVLEPTNEPYALAKIAGIKLCESYNRQHNTDFRSLMPTSLYGINDNFHPQNSHVIPALMQRFHHAKITGESQVTVWGTGNPKREFLYVDDMAEASIYMLKLEKEVYLENTSPMLSHINIGTGIDVTTRELAETIKEVVGFDGNLVFDTDKPDGAPRKLTDITRLKSMGWTHKTELSDGLARTYKWYLNQLSD
jgi:GDP-L-fucose synthase